MGGAPASGQVRITMCGSSGGEVEEKLPVNRVEDAQIGLRVYKKGKITINRR